MEIRTMRAEDWPAVRAIYEQGIATRQATFETEAPGWETWDADHLAEPRLVAEEDGAVVGFTPCLLRGRGRGQRVRRRGRARPGHRDRAPGEALLRRGCRRNLDDPDLDLSGERRKRRASPPLRLPCGRHSRADCATRRRLARHPAPRASRLGLFERVDRPHHIA